MIFGIFYITVLGTSRGRAAAARQAHNLKVVGLNPTPATKINQGHPLTGGFDLFLSCRKERMPQWHSRWDSKGILIF